MSLTLVFWIDTLILECQVADSMENKHLTDLMLNRLNDRESKEAAVS